MTLILASTSRYRKSLLQRLQIPFECRSPEVDESPLPGEPAEALALRLAGAKASAIASQAPEAWVLGSDQVAVVDGEVLGKPGNFERAFAQLQSSSGREARFLTGVALHRHRTGEAYAALHSTTVRFRDLSAADIEHYLRAEAPWDCAGSFKCEGLGIALFEAIHSDDPTGLEGLPLITTCRLLRQAGIDPLAPAAAN
ncbi:Maf family protein [Haliea sp. E17]|uniref:Maf family protein n=1 Tax=Haliea sp. E17 TaxID=3401576 RepID=UPI003AB0504C